MVSQHSDFMERAISLAQESAEKGTGPYGCVVVKDRKIIAESFNQVTKKNDATAHAEIEAIRAASAALDVFNLEDCSLYTSSYPCPMCFGAMHWAKIKNIYYANEIDLANAEGFADGFIYKELCSPNSKRKYKLEKVNIPNSEEPFLIWKNNTKKIIY